MDLRVKKTHRALVKALDMILDEKRYENITVSEICERAEVRRATFYEHFDSKEALVVFVIRDKIAAYAARIFERYPETAKQPQDFYVHVLHQSMELFEENRTRIKDAMLSDTFSLFTYLWQTEIIRDIQKRMEEDEKQGLRFLMPPDLSAHLFCGIIYGLFTWTMEQQKITDYDSAVKYVEKILLVE